MIDLAESFHCRLVDQCGSKFARLDTLAELESLADLPRVVPAGYVIPAGEDAEGSPQVKATHVQAHICTLQLVIVTRYAGDATGARAFAGLHVLREAAQDALVGWIPPESGGHRVQFISGRLASAAQNVTIWSDIFSVRRLIGRTPS